MSLLTMPVPCISVLASNPNLLSNFPSAIYRDGFRNKELNNLSSLCVNNAGPLLSVSSSLHTVHINFGDSPRETRRDPIANVVSSFSLWSKPGVPPNAVPIHRTSHLRAWRPSQVKSGDSEGTLSSENMILDEQTLEQDLQIAIKEENYAQAAKIRDNLRLLHEDNMASVLAANARFYNAFRNGDLAAMHTIWAKRENVYCVHPGAGGISSYDLVMGSWEHVCGADYEFPLQIELKNVEVHVRGAIGYVTCMEVVKTKGSSSWGKQVATNVFERIDGQWFMCIHHASHVDL
ncbi:uncharacterized protein LOC143879991 [Tasmannia lanceolata]|uniref:uncharacterized protein LOC143879991 n=1 Tax=Tasmannia lanceolata TaxID=3420 RepID=UPI0040635DF3